MPTVYDQMANSSYLDFTGYRITSQPDVESAYGISSSDVSSASYAGINVALVLGRVQDPTALLSENWAARQQTLAELGSAGTWATYGADPNQFNAIEQGLSSLHLTVLDGTNSNYVTSAQSRTIWVELNSADDFNRLFGTTLQQYIDPHRFEQGLRLLERQPFAASGLERPGPVVRHRERAARVQLRAGRFGDPGAGLPERRQRLVAAARPRRAGHCRALPFPAAGAQRGDRHDRPRRARHRLGPGARGDPDLPAIADDLSGQYRRERQRHRLCPGRQRTVLRRRRLGRAFARCRRRVGDQSQQQHRPL